LVVAGAPPGVVPALSALAAALGPELSLGEGFWQTRGLAWARASASL
jgi:hypothetical protein